MAGPIPKARWNKNDGQWYARFKVNGKRRYFALGAEEDAAKRKLRHLLVRYRRVKAEPPPQQGVDRAGNLAALCDGYLSTRVGQVKPRHYSEIERHLTRLCAFEFDDGGQLGYLRPQHLTDGHLRAFLEFSRVGGSWSPATTRHAHTHATAVMRWAVKAGILDRNPWVLVAPPKVPRKRMRVLSLAEIRKIIALAHNPKEQAFLAVMYETAARPSELIRARWADIESDKIVLHEHKTDGNAELRILYLSELAVRTIKDMPRPKRESPYIFPGRRIGKPLHRTAPYNMLKKIEAKAPELGTLAPRMFRRSRATHWLESGVHPRIIAELLGNTRDIALKHYALPTPDHVRRALQASA